jgi:hypothetical protein
MNQERPMRRLFAVATVLAIAVSSAVLSLAQDKKVDVTGTWELTLETPNGTSNPTAIFKQDGEKLTGTYKGRLGERPLEGTVKANEIKFAITLDFQGQQFTLSYSGKVDGDSMSGTVDFGGQGSGNWSGKRKKE